MIQKKQIAGGGDQRVSCTITVPGDGTLSVNVGAVGVPPGSTNVSIVPDPSGAAPNCVQLDFSSPLPSAEFAFLGSIAGDTSAFATGTLYQVPPSFSTQTNSRIVFFGSTPNGFLDFATALVNGGDFGAPVLLNVMCG